VKCHKLGLFRRIILREVVEYKAYHAIQIGLNTPHSCTERYSTSLALWGGGRNEYNFGHYEEHEAGLSCGSRCFGPIVLEAVFVDINAFHLGVNVHVLCGEIHQISTSLMTESGALLRLRTTIKITWRMEAHTSFLNGVIN
jgi:hypothetical protein